MSDLSWLTDEQMARLAPFFPESHGKPRVDDRRVVSGIIFVNRNGLRWRDAPREPVTTDARPSSSLPSPSRSRRSSTSASDQRVLSLTPNPSPLAEKHSNQGIDGDDQIGWHRLPAASRINVIAHREAAISSNVRFASGA